ncbi:MAG: hypothetical protein ACQEXJ_18480 [Myxococcota bacterium]
MIVTHRRAGLVVLATALLLLAPGALAEQYDVPILADSVGDLRSLLDNGDIRQDEFDRLVALLEDPLDVNTASRDAMYDLPGMTFPMIDRLVDAREKAPLVDIDSLRALGLPDNVLRQIGPFVVFRPPPPPEVPAPQPLGGDVELRSLEQLDDGKSPAFALRFRGEAAERVDLGLVGLFQDRLGTFDYHHETGRTWLTAEPAKPRFHLPKGYAAMDEGEWGVIAGTYQVGFAERLTFDASTRTRPSGFYGDDQVYENQESASFSAPERLLGVAATMRGVHLGGTHYLSGTLFGSFQPFEVPQHEIRSFLRKKDDSDFNDGTNPLLCEEGADPAACADDDLKTGRLSQEQLRRAFTEMLVGGHLRYTPMPRLKVGATAYYGAVDFPASDDLHFAVSSGFPDRSGFGAMGLDFEANVGDTVLSGEYSRTFEGDQAAFLRGVVGFRLLDVELQARYYGEDWDNPHSRGLAQPDELFGQRDRDEAGGSVRLILYPLRWMSARVEADLWHRMALDVTSYDLDGRLDLELQRWLSVSGGFQYTDRDISEGGRDADYGSDTVDLEGLEVSRPGDGARIAAYAQVAFALAGHTRLVLFYKSTFTDDAVSADSTYYREDIAADLHDWFETHFRHDWYVSASARTRPTDALTLQTRVKYLVEDAAWAFRGEEYVEGWFQGRYVFDVGLWLLLRYRFRAFTDDRHLAEFRRDPTRPDDPEPEPEHLFKASIGFGF